MSSMSRHVLRKPSVIVAGGTVYVAAVVMGYTFLQRSQEGPKACSCSCAHSAVNDPRRAQQFQNIASNYDESIGRDECFMGINLLRRFLLRHAHGNVLEVGAGTGRNLPYYNLQKCQRILLTDASDQMLEQTRRKLQSQLKLATSTQAFAVLQRDAATLTSDPQKPLPLNAFDTVVDTFGLCSYDDPVQALREMLQVVKPDGRILLLEHGRSKTWQFVTNHLDKYAEKHARNWGCVWNRDLDDILKQAGLEIEYQQVWHFGTTYYLICKKKETI